MKTGWLEPAGLAGTATALAGQSVEPAKGKLVEIATSTAGTARHGIYVDVPMYAGGGCKQVGAEIHLRTQNAKTFACPTLSCDAVEVGQCAGREEGPVKTTYRFASHSSSRCLVKGLREVHPAKVGVGSRGRAST